MISKTRCCCSENDVVKNQVKHYCFLGMTVISKKSLWFIATPLLAISFVMTCSLVFFLCRSLNSWSGIIAFSILKLHCWSNTPNLIDHSKSAFCCFIKANPSPPRTHSPIHSLEPSLLKTQHTHTHVHSLTDMHTGC